MDSGSSRSLDDVCAELDAELVASLEALQKYMEAHVMASELWKRGFLALARARRASNSPAAFSSQFPKEIMATVVARASAVGEDAAEEIEIERIAFEADEGSRPPPQSRTKPGPPMPPVAGHLPSRPPAEDSFSSMCGNVLTYEDEDGITHVTHVQSPMTFSPSSLSTVNASMFAALVAQGSAEAEAGHGSERPSDAVSALKEQIVHAPRLRAPPTQHDPLKWFGVLVPPSLREGQRTFERLMPVLALQASAQAALELHSSRCAALRAEKGRMTAAL
jgi:hypothetical protein